MTEEEKERLEKEIHEAKRDEARANADKAKAEAQRAQEEVHHERSKREKTERETEFVNHKKWHEAGKVLIGFGGLVLSVLAFRAKKK